MNFTAFALGLMQDRTEAKFKNMESQHKVRAILAVFTKYKSSIFCEVIRKHQVTSLFCKDCISLVISIFFTSFYVIEYRLLTSKDIASLAIFY